jgi:putative membrane protein
MLALFVALVSPLDALGTALFSAHMVQHMVLVLVAVPLLVLGAPQTGLLWALAEPRRRRLGAWWHCATGLRIGWRALSRPLVVWLLHAAALWLWHLPRLYQAALTSELVHLAEHASFLGTALLFWWVLLGGSPRERLNPALGVLYLFSFALQGGLLGALMTFAPAPWYPAYTTTVAAWGLTPLEDQQLAGLIMWVPAGLVYLAAALVPLGELLEGEKVEGRGEKVEGRR